MGFLLTSAILLLFFKYSQVIVFKAVQYALSSHPGLETSDDLRSSAVSFSHDVENFVNIAKMIAWSYVTRNISGYNINTLRGSAFLNLLYTYEIAMGSSIRHAFLRGFNATNTSNILYERNDGFVENLEFVREAEKLTPKDRERGIWQRPNQFQDRFYNQTLQVMTSVIPIHFDAMTAKCTAVAGVEVSPASFAESICVPTANTEVVLVIPDIYRRRGTSCGGYDIDRFTRGNAVSVYSYTA
ncbi:hypothetical protein LSM04_006985 [Trypanosoma melophagium]|uniref:uncharacterized protein n=1 Tax=Trypanosoma melophagium TaxID=715481 RepID=UPI00351A32C5|nr:hypothetical protein LSM04_006985 [Trypanosoma melophagium]